jgi:hypothetical protein
VYVLLRATMGLRRGPALLGAALSSAGALLLWIGYFNFEKQMAAWPLIPLGLLIGVAAVEQLAGLTTDDRRPTTNEPGPWSSVVGGRSSQTSVALLAAITLAALPVAYYPALTLWVPLAAGLALAILIEQAWGNSRLPAPVTTGAGPGVRAIPAIPRLLLATVALAILTAFVSAPAILDYWHGFAYRYNEQLTTLGVFFYIPATAILGLTPYLHGQIEPPQSIWALLGLAAFGILALAGLLLPATADQRPRTKDEGFRQRSSFVLRPSSQQRYSDGIVRLTRRDLVVVGVLLLVYYAIIERILLMRLMPAAAIDILYKRFYRLGRPLAGEYTRAELVLFSAPGKPRALASQCVRKRLRKCR